MVDHLNPDLLFKGFLRILKKGNFGWSYENQPKPKNPELCSDHFHVEDVLTKANGAKYIRKGANPRRCEGLLFFNDLSNSSDSTIFGTPPVKKKKH